MANRRMFTMDIVDSDAFLEMPLSTQALYFHLCMRADDDGFLNNPLKIQRMIGANPNDYDILIGKRFILAIERGIIVIKHWKMHNYIPKDRYKPTQYQELLALLEIKENNSYTECNTTCIQPVYKMDTQVRLGKDRLDKDSKDIYNVPYTVEEVIEEKPKIMKHKHGEFKKVLLTDSDLKKLHETYGEEKTNDFIKRLDEYIENTGKKYKNHYLTIRTWIRNEKEKPKEKKSGFAGYEQRGIDYSDIKMGWS